VIYLVIWGSRERLIARSLDHQVTRSPDHQIDHAITRSPHQQMCGN
jgi:hypothetical protein